MRITGMARQALAVALLAAGGALALPGMAAPAGAAEVPPSEVVVADFAVGQPLTDAPGDPAAGRKHFADRKLGNCLACHANTDLSEQLFHGNVGPPIDGVAERWEPAQLRAIVVNSKAVFGPETVMPGFYSLDVGADIRKDLAGQTILTAQQVEDIVAYLSTLK